MPTTSVPKNLETLSNKQLVEWEGKISAERNKRFAALETSIPRLQSELGAKLSRMLDEIGLPPVAAQVTVSTPGNGAHKAVKATSAKRRPRKATIPVKYRNPENPTETWTGRGRPKAWLAAKLKAGETMDKYLVR